MLVSTGYLPRPPIPRPANDQRPLQGEDSEGPDGAQPRHNGDGSIHLRITKLVNVMMNKTSRAFSEFNNTKRETAMLLLYKSFRCSIGLSEIS